jgi:transcription elongation GreA/GreB family factor/transcription elongation factor GreA-like protein
MEDSQIQNLIEEQRYEDAEALWLELLESGSFDIDQLLHAAKQLRRQKEKDRARILVGLLAEQCREMENSVGRLQVLREMARFEPLEQSKIQIRETLLKLHPDKPSLLRLLRHFAYDDIASPEDLLQKLKKIERWMQIDTGEIVYHPRYGAGKVAEVNYNLDLVRIDFETKKDVAFEMNDTELIRLPARHLLREKLESPDNLKQQLISDPGGTVGRLLETFQRPMKVSEIREVFRGLIAEEHWTSWWNSARKHPQLLASGKGAQAVYSWSSSAEDAETILRAEFDHGDLITRMEITKRLGHRNPQLLKYFEESLISDAQRAFEEKQMAHALQLYDFFHKNISGAEKSIGYTFESLVQQTEPLSLLSSLNGTRLDALKEKVLLSLPALFPERWKSIYKDSFFQEENPRILELLLEKLQEPGEGAGVMERLFDQPHRYPAQFVWICENYLKLESKSDIELTRKPDGRFLIHAITALDETQFSPYRRRLKNALEKGLLLQVLKLPIQKSEAEKVIRLLEHASNLEEYRREKLKALVYAWIPEMKQKENLIFTTQEALTRKKKELEQLVQIELPANRKAVGEAAAHGDLRENAEYKAARERQDYLISRAEVLQQELSRARIIEPGQIDCSEVRPGTRVALKQSSGKELAIIILGLWDSNPKEGIYSYQSAIGANLLGKLPGDTTELNGEQWIIEKIEPWM